jgi:hypothetical protein
VENQVEEFKGQICEQLYKVTPKQWENFFVAVEKQMKDEGINLREDVFRDQSVMLKYISTFQKTVGCKEPPPPPLKPVHYSPELHTTHHESNSADNFCGPDHGGLLNLIPVSNCLNKICYIHDSCYARCSEKSGGAFCSWNDMTKPCDDPFFEEANKCNFELGTIIASNAILLAAKSLRKNPTNTSNCASGMTCPWPGEFAKGPCESNENKILCDACLSKNDPGRECYNSASCVDSEDQTLCYTANCGEYVWECFGKPYSGGTGGGSGSGGNSGTGGNPFGGSAGVGGSGQVGGSGGTSGSGGSSGAGGSGGVSGSGGGGAGPLCFDYQPEPGETYQTAYELTNISDSDGIWQIEGLITDSMDKDYYTYYGDDVATGEVAPGAYVSTPGLRLCLWSQCAYPTPVFCKETAAPPDLPSSYAGCCVSTPATVSVSTDCNGWDDDARIYMRVAPAEPVNACIYYNLKYWYGD